MLLTCPACGARYRIDADLIGPGGRTVRCSACAAEWTEGGGSPASGASAIPVTPPDEPTPPAQPWFEPLEQPDHRLAATLEEPPSERGGAAFLGGFVSAVTLSLLAALLYLRHEQAVALAPPLADAIAAWVALVDEARARLAAVVAGL